VVKASEMPPELQDEIARLCGELIRKGRLPREVDVAQALKRELEERHKGCWHCIVGRAFGSALSHEAGNFIYLYVDDIAVLVFRTA